jgi:hypothetical protein
VLDVPGWFDQRDERPVYSKLKHRRARVAGSAGHDILFAVYYFEASQGQ